MEPGDKYIFKWISGVGLHFSHIPMAYRVGWFSFFLRVCCENTPAIVCVGGVRGVVCMNTIKKEISKIHQLVSQA